MLTDSLSKQELSELIATLKQQVFRLKQILESVPDIIYSVDTSGTFIFLGPQACDYGFDHKKLIGRSVFSIIHEQDQNKVKKEFLSSIKSRENFRCELRIVNPSADEFWIESNGVLQYDHEGNVVELIGTLRNISVRKTYENSLKKSEERSQSILENANGGILLADTDGKILLANTLACEYFQLSLIHI